MLTSRFQKSSQRLVNHFGTNRTYKKLGASSYNVDTQEHTSAETTYTVKSYKSKTTDSESRSPNLIDKDVAVILIAGADIAFRPEQGDVILDSSSALTVVTVKEHWAGDSVALWRLICTQG